MTDTTPVVPTDAEIEALGHRMCWRYKHDTGVNHISTFTFHAQTLHDFAREVLAKWGTSAAQGAPQAPHPVACEPLIRQMRNALALPCDRWNATQSRIVREAINAADAWLEGKK